MRTESTGASFGIDKVSSAVAALIVVTSVVCTFTSGCCFSTELSTSESELLLLDEEDNDDDVSESPESLSEDMVELDSSLVDETCMW